MAEVVNLRSVRKSKEREKARSDGDANAARFGRTKAQKALEQAQAKAAARTLDGAKRE